ncbi:MAG: hypothetical protein Q8M92_03265 [Candidatus Subteraquimicrobiales bacterium]|nr:hypothetical protein [Candidatus Subteraquimicrobiales bacterium]
MNKYLVINKDVKGKGIPDFSKIELGFVNSKNLKTALIVAKKKYGKKYKKLGVVRAENW